MNWMQKEKNRNGFLFKEERKIKEHFGRIQAEKREQIKDKERSKGVSQDLLNLAYVSATARNSFDEPNNPTHVEALEGLLESPIKKKNKKRKTNKSTVPNSQLTSSSSHFSPFKNKINSGKNEEEKNLKNDPVLNSFSSFNEGIDNLIFTQSTPLVSKVVTKKRTSLPSNLADSCIPDIKKFSDMSKLNLFSPISTSKQDNQNNNQIINKNHINQNSTLQQIVLEKTNSFLQNQDIIKPEYQLNYEENSSYLNDEYDIKLEMEQRSPNLNVNSRSSNCKETPFYQPTTETTYETQKEINKLNSEENLFETFNADKFEEYFRCSPSLYDEGFEANEFISNQENFDLYVDNFNTFPTLPLSYSDFEQNKYLNKQISSISCFDNISVSDESIFLSDNKINAYRNQKLMSPDFQSNPISYSPNLDILSPDYNSFSYSPNTPALLSDHLVNNPDLINSPKPPEMDQKVDPNNDSNSQIVPPLQSVRNSTIIYKDIATSPIKWPMISKSMQTE